MPSPYDTRRYLTHFDSNRAGNIFTDVLVIGSGVAGMRAALEAARFGSVTLVTKGEFDLSATSLAQGGIAVALREDDSPTSHAADTLRVGCGLCDPEAVKILTTDASRRIEELVEWGIQLDREETSFSLGREGGHSHCRIVHADGDQTGREVVRALKARILGTDNIRVFEHCFFIDLVTLDKVCVGIVAFHARHGHQLIRATQTILASGGCGMLWRETTNPSCATGDGTAAAFRAGATLCDLEMMQFHPTTLYVAGAGRALISEAVRGEGAYLLDKAGERFMQDYDPAGELAPRDIVSRAIHDHLSKTGADCAYLDVRHLKGFDKRFPFISRLCADFEIDTNRDLIPVRPSAHYMIGGIDTGLDGTTSIEGLLCCGEAARSGVHGANRLASNSLLEGLVFGLRAGDTAGRLAGKAASTAARHLAGKAPPVSRTPLNLADIRNSLRSMMWRNVGIVRSGTGLSETCEILDFWGHYTLDKTFDDIPGWEIQNLLTVARLAAMSALERTESIGVHYRADATETGERYHVHVRRTPTGTTAVRR